MTMTLQDHITRRFSEANRYQFGLLAILFVSLSTLPLWAPITGFGGLIYPLALANIWAIFAMGWDIISGYTGYISFGHSALSGAAAYATAMLATHLELPLAATFPLSVVAALIVGMLFALPSLRLRGPYFSLLTLVGALLFYRLLFVFNEYTGGELGMSVEAITYDTTVLYYYTFVPMVFIALGLLYVSRSNVGVVLVAIRENEPAVESAGIDTTKFKLWAFTLSAVTMGVGGVMLAHFYGSVDPTTMVILDRSIEMIVMAVIGGMSSILGPIGGAYVFILLRDTILPGTLGLGGTQRWFALWAVALGLIVFAREGVFRKLWHGLGEQGSENESETE